MKKGIFLKKFINKITIKNILQIISSKYLKNNNLLCLV